MLDAERGLEVHGASDVEGQAVEVGLKVREIEHQRARVGVGALEGGDRERLGVRAGALGDGEEVVEAVAGLEELGVEVEAHGLRVGELWLGGGWHVFDSRVVWVVCAGQSAALGRVVGRTTRPERADAGWPRGGQDPPLEGAGSAGRARPRIAA
ncbi:MAG: hypothetical protein IPN01_35885 [Deltaproteobacteria bacterium]|nr:hypothetical protein [Deltaproteobacteria bacterium]